MAAAESWEGHPEDDTLVREMNQWRHDTAIMPEGAVGYASWPEYLEYCRELRRPEAAGLPPTTLANRMGTPEREATAMKSGVGRILDHLGLHFG